MKITCVIPEGLSHRGAETRIEGPQASTLLDPLWGKVPHWWSSLLPSAVAPQGCLSLSSSVSPLDASEI